MTAATAQTPSRPRVMDAPLLVAVGAFGILVYAALPRGPLADALFVAISVMAAGAVIVGVRQRAPLLRGAWGSVAVALAMMALGNVAAWLAGTPALADMRVIGDVLFLLAYLPLLFAAYRFGRGTQRSDATAFLDSGIIGLAAIPLVWEVLIEPNVPPTMVGPEPLAAAAIPILDVLLVSLVAPLILFRHSRSQASFLLVAGLVAMGVGDSVYAMGILGGSWSASTLDNLGWLTSYVLLGAAALVPSATNLGAAHDPRPGARDTSRLIVVAAGLLVGPLVSIRESVTELSGGLLPYSVLSLAVASLVILRLQRTIAQLRAIDQRFRRFMSHDDLVAVIKDAAGRYIYMNPTAAAIPRLGGGDWYGLTDRELYPPELAEARVAADAIVRATDATMTTTIEIDGRTWHTERFGIRAGGGEIGVFGVDISDRVRAEREVGFQARLLESVRDAVVVVDTTGRFTYWNKGAEAMFGCSAEEMLGQDMMANVGPSSKEQVEALWHAANRGESDLGEWLNARRDGTHLWVHARMSPISDEAGAPAGFLAILEDVTAGKRSELELRRLRLAIDHANDAIIVTDADDRVTYVNPAFERMTGFSALEVAGRRPADNPAGAAFARALERARGRAGGWRGDVVDQRRDGSDLVAQTSVSPISAIGEPSAGFVTIKRDVTHERAAERAAERRARERSLIAETLAALHAGESPEETAEAVCRQLTKLPELSVGSLITFGVDGTATVLAQAGRDGDGHAGVDLTPERSAYLRTRAEAGPWVERWSGDRSHPYYAAFIELGIMANAYAPLLVGDRPIGLLVGASDQVDALERLTERLPALVEFAAITTTLLAGPVADRLALARQREQLRSVIEAQAFEIHFQPIVDLATGATRGYEALTRFDDGVAPDVRFARASELGLGLELEAACIRAAVTAAAELPPDAWLNVNVSPEIVLSGRMDALIPAGSRDVVLEVTEHQAITDYAGFREAVDPIRDRVRIAIDDAGAGFASLRHIVELAPSMVKLDRSLVAGIGEDSARQAVVSGMVQFARSAGLSLIAEGIETDAELIVLRALGVGLGQGYLLGEPRPMPASGPVAASVTGQHRPRQGAAPRRRGPSGRRAFVLQADLSAP